MSGVFYPGIPFFKNRIINGDFSIWQRGTTFTATGGGTGASGYSADRWKWSADTGSVDIAKSTMQGYNSIRLTVGTAADFTAGTFANFLFYIFEGQHLYDLTTKQSNITISFWFMSNVTGEFTVALQNRTGADSTVWDSYVAPFQYTTADTPQKVEVTIPLNHTWSTAPVNDNNQGFFLFIAPTGNQTTTTTNAWISGTNVTVTSNTVQWTTAVGNYIEVSQVQLEEGSTATDFEYIPYEVQLLRCLRYYEKAVVPNEMAHGELVQVGLIRNFPYIPFKVYKRTDPTIKVYSYNDTLGKVSYLTGATELTGTWEITQVSQYGFANASTQDSTDSVGTKFWFKWEADAEL